MTRSALISGAGIAGPALAFWLARSGWAVTVVERAAAPRPGGQAVDLRGVARTVVERMGLLDEVRTLAVRQHGLAWVRSDGSVAARMPVDAFGGEGIVSEIEVLRGDLAGVLHDATADDVEYFFDDAVVGMMQDTDGVDVSFGRSAPRRYDLVVGADGSHSAVRALAFGPEAECTRPLDLYAAWFTVPADIDVDGWFLMYNAPGGRVASLRPGRLPGEHKAALYFRSAPRTFDRADAEAQKRFVTDHLDGAGWEVPGLLTAMADADDFTLDAVAQVRLPAWSRQRVVLLGDAAWCPTPLTGLGTSLALVGAFVLAGELTATDDVRAALDRYEDRLRPYVTSAQSLPPGGVGAFAPSRALDIRVRLRLMRWMTRWPFRTMMARQFDKAAAFTLPHYTEVGAGSR